MLFSRRHRVWPVLTAFGLFPLIGPEVTRLSYGAIYGPRLVLEGQEGHRSFRQKVFYRPFLLKMCHVLATFPKTAFFGNVAYALRSGIKGLQLPRQENQAPFSGMLPKIGSRWHFIAASLPLGLIARTFELGLLTASRHGLIPRRRGHRKRRCWGRCCRVWTHGNSTSSGSE